MRRRNDTVEQSFVFYDSNGDGLVSIQGELNLLRK